MKLVLTIVLAIGASCVADDTWKAWLKNPPAEAVAAYSRLSQQADAIAATIAKGTATLGDVDLVFSGGGNLDAYALGVAMVVNRLHQQTSGQAVNVYRYSGCSSGGMTAFDLVLKGESSTVTNKIALQILMEKAGWSGDQAARETEVGEWETKTYASKLSTLDGKVALSLTCPLQEHWLEWVDTYTSPEQAYQAYKMTGSIGEYQGKLCMDGGQVSGPDMTPLFKDGLRAQLIVNLLAWGDGFSGVNENNAANYQKKISAGMTTLSTFFLKNLGAADKISEFPSLKSRSDHAITFCPKGSKVGGNVCKAKSAVEPRSIMV